MKKYLKKLPQELVELIELSGNISEILGYTAYLVGGFVRDLLLGVKNFDLDIVIEGDGIKFAEELAARLKAKCTRHKRFGTATIHLKPHLKIDIVTARKEFYPTPASLPVVTFGRIEDDLSRRDFTINALAVSINRKSFGRFMDLFDGKADLADKKICILHDLSFVDDPTRILRAIRFEQRFGFAIEKKTLKYLREAVRIKMLEKVQPQRLRDEIILMLKEEHPIKQIKRLEQLAGLQFINPHLKISKKTDALLNSIDGQVNWFKHEFPHRRQLDNWLVYFMGLVDSLEVSQINSISKKFVFRQGEEKRMLAYKEISLKIIAELSRPAVKPSKVFKLLESLSYEITLLIKAKSKDINLQRNIEDFFKIYNGMRILISGEDLRKLGVVPGPDYQKIFHKVLDARLDGQVKTREEELALARRLTK